MRFFHMFDGENHQLNNFTHQKPQQKNLRGPSSESKVPNPPPTTPGNQALWSGIWITRITRIPSFPGWKTSSQGFWCPKFPVIPGSRHSQAVHSQVLASPKSNLLNRFVDLTTMHRDTPRSLIGKFGKHHLSNQQTSRLLVGPCLEKWRGTSGGTWKVLGIYLKKYF